MKNEPDTLKQDRKAALRAEREEMERRKVADYRADIGALLDKIGMDAEGSTCTTNLATIRSALVELVASQMYHLYDGDEAATREAIEDNLEGMREAHRVTIKGANGKTTTVSIPPREQ